MSIAESLDEVVNKLKSGFTLEAEKLLTDLILDYVGSPDAPSLLRVFQISPDFRLAARLSEFKAAVEDRREVSLMACFLTLVGPLALDEMTGGVGDQLENAYVDLCNRADDARMVRLFEDRSEQILSVNLNVPITTCNYRCPYCFLNHAASPGLDKLDLMPQIIERLALIPRPIAVTFGPHGDILAVPAMWPLFKKLAVLPNLQWVEIWTNLSRDLDVITQHIPLNRLSVIATYHPSQFPEKQFNERNAAFFRRLAELKEHSVGVTVNFVTSTVNMPYFNFLQRTLKEMGVYLTVNPVQGALNGDGKVYPEAYSRQDWLKIQKWCQNEVYAFFVANNKAKVRCSAGVDMIDIRYNGVVARCEHQPVDRGYGNILDEGGPYLDTVNRYCWMDGCPCKSTIGYTQPVMAEFARGHTQHHFIRRDQPDRWARSFQSIVSQSNR